MLETKIRVKIISETILNDVSLNEAKQIADMLEMRSSIPTFLGNISYTYSEIEKVE
jgi:hypothetical protein